MHNPINVVVTLKNSLKTTTIMFWKGRNAAACFTQPVVTPLWDIWVGIPVMSFKFQKKKNTNYFCNRSEFSDDVTLGCNQNKEGKATHNTIYFIKKVFPEWFTPMIFHIQACGLWASLTNFLVIWFFSTLSYELAMLSSIGKCKCMYCDKTAL